ncbi:uncharacterized protein LOC110609813 [Manihot esculenta]|uniref:uncharacterized protein LOC110609813 n=1 Tax=Manihot esculenta TaxID=3983 RepID=UPI000B5D7432|nr:uncharacterized protein LOC110609813 [Manihot esculenta]
MEQRLWMVVLAVDGEGGLRLEYDSVTLSISVSSLPSSQPPRLPSRPGAKPHYHLKVLFLTGAADSTQPSTIASSSSARTLVSFGVVRLGYGISVLLRQCNFSFPLTGRACRTEASTPCLTYSDALMLRETSATPILKQVKCDVTRYRYRDEQHLDEALKRNFQYGQGGGIPKRSAPILHMIREEVCFLICIKKQQMLIGLHSKII